MKIRLLAIISLWILLSKVIWAASTSPHLPTFAFTFSDPVPHTINQHYLYGEYKSYNRGHTGIDFRCPHGTDVKAAKGGTVIALANDGTGYGKYIIIDHGKLDGLYHVYTLYAHLSTFIVSYGYVTEGQVIAKSGNTGNSTGPHLHFEVRYKTNVYGSVLNPEMLLKDSIDNGNWGAAYGYVYDMRTTYSIAGVRIRGNGLDKPASIEDGKNFGSMYTYLPMTSSGSKARDIYDFDINYLTGQLNPTVSTITLEYSKSGYTKEYESTSITEGEAKQEVIPMN